MPHTTIKLLAALAVITTLTISCKQEEELPCDDYYLASATREDITFDFLYNTDAQVVSVAATDNFGTTLTTFQYDLDKVLVMASSGQVDHMFQFDGAGKLVAINRIIDGSHTDSINFEYDAQGRMLKTSFFNARVTPSELIHYYQYQYASDSEVEVKQYMISLANPGQFDLHGTFTYQMDDKPLPYPVEYYYILAAFANHSLQHNVTSFELTDAFEPASGEFTYQYNVGGYPTRQAPTGIGSIQRFTYSCTPPQQ